MTAIADRENHDPFDLLGAARQAAEVLGDLAATQADVVGPTWARLATAISLAAPLAKKVWTPTEIADRFRVNVSTVRGWIDDGELEAFNAGRGTVKHWRVVESAVLRFAEERRKGRCSA